MLKIISCILLLSSFSAFSTVECIAQKTKELYYNKYFLGQVNKSDVMIAASNICKNGGTIACVISKSSALQNHDFFRGQIDKNRTIISASTICAHN